MRPRLPSAKEERAEANRVTASLAGLAAALLLIVLGLFLVHHLNAAARIEDCLMAGRNNCDQLIPR